MNRNWPVTNPTHRSITYQEGTTMQPWRISAGLTAAIADSVVLVAGSRLKYLVPFWRVIFVDYGLVIAAHLGLAWAPWRPHSTVSHAPPGSPIWEGGSIWSSARSGVARVIPISPKPSGGIPRVSGSERKDVASYVTPLIRGCKSHSAE